MGLIQLYCILNLVIFCKSACCCNSKILPEVDNSLSSFQIFLLCKNITLQLLIIVSGPEGYWLVCAVQFMYCISGIFDPPKINRIESHVLGCLNYSWSLAKSQEWLTTAISLELRLKTVNNQHDKELVSDCFSQ